MNSTNQIQVFNPRYSNETLDQIDCEIEHPQFGRIPFTACKDDCEQMSKDIFESIAQGEFGQIASFKQTPQSEVSLAEFSRAQRNALLSASDWTQLQDAQAAMNETQKTSWATYRRLLRDVPKQTEFPHKIDWPVQP